jgi:hypothetical protein
MFIYIFNSVKGMESKNLVMDEYNIKLNYERDRLYGLSKDSIIELSKLKKNQNGCQSLG